MNAREFKKFLGRLPIEDELERVNCSSAGELGHWHCGWCHEKNLPRSMSTAFILNKESN